VVRGYQIKRQIGEGATGTVWEAVQLGTDRRVALKILRPRLLESPRACSRFEREVRLAARLEHPHIARIYESGVHRGVHYFAMELVKGVPLDRYVGTRGLDVRHILKLVSQTCTAVGYAHGHGIVHRDLKPKNILVTAGGEPRILDFGLAKALTGATKESFSLEGEVAGTPAFMSPEQAAGKRVDTRSDVYSLGVVLYRLLLRDTPHDLSGGPLDLIRRIVSEPPRRPRSFAPEFDARLEAVLMKALAMEPASRYATAAELAADLAAYLAGEPLSVAPIDAAHPLDPEQLFKFFNALRRGDFSARLPAGQAGRAGEAALVANAFVADLTRLTDEIIRVATELASEGRFGGWLDVLPQYGQWKRVADGVNSLAGGLTERIRDLNQTLRLLAKGDLSRKLTGDLHGDVYKGELLDLKTAVNALIDRLRAEAPVASDAQKKNPITPALPPG
jgi:hypothetical protein